MAKWFVGQMVRMVKPVNPNNYGIIGVIKSMDSLPAGTLLNGGYFMPFSSDCTVSYQGYLNGLPAVSAFWQLEPILYDGAQPIADSFEEMMGKLREGVIA